MRQVFVLQYKGPNVVEAFESYDDAVNAGVEFIVEMVRRTVYLKWK